MRKTYWITTTQMLDKEELLAEEKGTEISVSKDDQIERIRFFWRAWEPQISPWPWLVVNSMALGYSLIMFLFLIGLDDWGAFKHWKSFAGFTRHSYILYDFITCVVWCVEVLVPLFSRGFTMLGWASKIELALALLLCGSSIYTLLRWKLSSDTTTGEMMFGVILNAVSYVYAIVICANAIRDPRRAFNKIQQRDSR